MKKLYPTILTLFLLYFTQIVFANDTTKVNNVKEFLEAISSNKIIELQTGTYNLTNLDLNTSPFLNIKEQEFKSLEPVFDGLSNLQLIGKGEVKIIIDIRTAWVMIFDNASNLTLKNLILGHDVAGGCSGGVIKFRKSKNIRLDNLSLYGSGTIGLELSDCEDVKVNNCDIHECTYHLLNILNSKNIFFQNTQFRETGQFDMLKFEKTLNVSFNKCQFLNNFNGVHFSGNDFITLKGKITKLEFKKCLFENNNFPRFVNRLGIVKLSKCKFKNNAFPKP